MTTAVAESSSHDSRGRTAEHLLYPDLIRILSILGVICIHLCSPHMRTNPLGSREWWFANSFDAAARFSVTLFVMISGVFLLDPTRTETPGGFLKKRFSRILVPAVAWTLIYYAWELAGGKTGLSGFSWPILGQRLLGNGNMYHFWFIYMLMGLYLATPVIRPFMTSRQNMRYYLMTWVLFVVVLELLKQHFRFKTSLANYVFNAYLGAFVLGRYLHEVPVLRSWSLRAVLGVVWAGCLWVTAAGNHAVLSRGGSMEVYFGYLSWNVLLMAISAFLFVKSLDLSNLERHKRLIGFVSASVFGIYLVHILIINRITRFEVKLDMRSVPTTAWLDLPINLPLTFIVSLAIVAIIMKVPLLRKAV